MAAQRTREISRFQRDVRALHSTPSLSIFINPYHVLDSVSTLKAALELKNVFEQIQAAEKSGNLSPEEKRRLEEQAAEKGLQALFKGAKLEIESVLRETCDRVLEDPAINRNKAHLRAVALQILGDAYLSVKKDDEPGSEDREYVKIETKNSRQRDSQRGYAS